MKTNQPQPQKTENAVSTLAAIVARAKEIESLPYQDLVQIITKVPNGPPCILALHDSSSAYAEIGGTKSPEPLISRGVSLRGSAQIALNGGTWTLAPENRAYVHRVEGGTPSFMLPDPTGPMKAALLAAILAAANSDPIAPALFAEAEAASKARELSRHASTVARGASDFCEGKPHSGHDKAGDVWGSILAIAADLDRQGA